MFIIKHGAVGSVLHEHHTEDEDEIAELVQDWLDTMPDGGDSITIVRLEDDD